MTRPEHLMPPEQFYDEKEARKYTNCSRIIQVQSEMTQRCLELIGLDDQENCFILDLGCGSGLSGEMVEKYNHFWWGLDISPNMLEVAQEREVKGELLLSDLGQGFHTKPGFFDAIISVSALQWLCNADKKINNPWKRLTRFFQSVQRSLKNDGKAAIQLYPENNEQLETISNAAMKCGLTGGIYVDYPNSSKARKYYLILSTSCEGKLGVVMKEGKTDEERCEKVKGKRKKKIKKKDKFSFKSRYWIYQKKERQRKQGKCVRVDTKYTGRKRKNYFQLNLKQNEFEQ